MLDLEMLEEQIEEFIEFSGDDISSVINHGNVLSFSHVTLIEKNFSYEVSLDENGVITLTKQSPISNKSALDSNVEDTVAETLLEEVVVAKESANNIQDVIAFVTKMAN